MRFFAFLFGREPALAPTPRQETVTHRAIQHLIRHGVIDARTIRLMGVNSPTCVICRLRRRGYLYPLTHRRAFQELANSSGYGKYRMHYWSGKEPPKAKRERTA